MGFLDNISKSITQGVDRAKFEADKFQKTTRLQGEINDLQRQIDTKRAELGDRAMELYKAGQIQSPTLADIVKALDGLRSSVTLKEEELKTAQALVFVEPPPAPTPPPAAAPTPAAPTPAQPTSAPATSGQSVAVSKLCTNCQFQMPATALFCPNCGARQTA